ncbi:MAG: hypothetical protein N3D16_05930 [Anaerolineales bacterium]|nr:hypothetical protein [Anaerolineales bacterium]
MLSLFEEQINWVIRLNWRAKAPELYADNDQEVESKILPDDVCDTWAKCVSI